METHNDNTTMEFKLTNGILRRKFVTRFFLFMVQTETVGASNNYDNYGLSNTPVHPVINYILNFNSPHPFRNW